MTALAEPASAARAATLRTLAGVEARRYARHPLFLIGVALLILMTATESYGGFDARSAGATFVPAFFLGVLGVFVAFGLTRSMVPSTDAVGAAPTSGITRTAALCLACLVPAAVAVGWVTWTYVTMSIWSMTASAAISTWELVFMFAAAVLYAAGGPLVGVMVGRWTRFPGAGLIAAVALVGWYVLASVISVVAMPESRLSTLVHLNSPFTIWVVSEGNEHPWFAGGSPGWYLVYLTLLCGLAATAAMLHEASGRQRSRLVRLLVILAGLAIASLGLAAAGDPTRVPL